MARKKPLSEQVVVVAGGTYGLGRAIVRAVTDRGAKVAIGGRDEDALTGAVAEVEAAGSEAIAVQTDVAQQSFCAPQPSGNSRIGFSQQCATASANGSGW